jgi:peptidoglycan/LPS O-acetylase OafA/YrhL
LLFANTAIAEFHWWLRCICGYFSGCLSGAAYEKIAHRKIAGGWSAVALIAFLPFMMLPMSEATTELVFPLSVFVVLSLALAPESAASKLLHWRPLRWLGAISYSLYMCHAIVFWVIRQAVRVVLKAPDITVDGKTVAQVSPYMAAALYLVAVTGPLVLAWLSFRFIENPARKYTRKVVASWRERPSETIVVPDAVT